MLPNLNYFSCSHLDSHFKNDKNWKNKALQFVLDMDPELKLCCLQKNHISSRNSLKCSKYYYEQLTDIVKDMKTNKVQPAADDQFHINDSLNNNTF